MCYNQLVELNQQKMDLEVIMNKKIIGFLTLMTSLLLFASVASASKIDVNLNNVVNNLTVPVKFDSVAPMTINNSTVVPLRKFCETAGFEVHWTDSEKTAHIILKTTKAHLPPAKIPPATPSLNTVFSHKKSPSKLIFCPYNKIFVNWSIPNIITAKRIKLINYLPHLLKIFLVLLKL